MRNLQDASSTPARRAIVRCVLALTCLASVAMLGESPALAGNTDAFKAHAKGSAITVDHTAWNSLLQRHVKPGADGVNRVDYGTFKSTGHPALKAYVSALQKVDPATLDRPEQFAFWANLYNAKTIDIVLDHYPVASIRDITIGGGLFDLVKKSVGAGGPWKAEVLEVSGRPLSLDAIEHEILRPIFKDPRVHYSVNCASFGCPNLPSEAFTGAKLEAQLDAGATAFINHPRGFAVANGAVTASSIYNWFAADFGGSAQGVLDHARKYASPGLKAKLDGITGIDSYQYDWSLNDTAKSKS
ncbi:MAG: DUF547 domain-containing protein [Hyphomicrobiaceae bacterium]|nr:DUF547 domain-containing protein [Hyphomicrobiaceae bacterium]